MTKITRGVLESYIACRYKAYLMLAGHEAETGHEHEPQAPTNSEQVSSLEEIAYLQNGNRVNSQVDLTAKLLGKGLPEIPDGLHQTAFAFLEFDGLQKFDGKSAIGDFHYVPILLYQAGQMQEAQRVLLDVYGYILAKLQGRSPEYGIIRRPEGKSATVSLSRNLKKGESVLNDLFEMQSSMAPPKLFLNLHCQTCQFQKRCRAQAIEEDSLSLLRGISQTEITRLNRKGIFTINQLSYTFRPRRIKKRAKKPLHRHYFALQVLAIREQKIFVHAPPKFQPKDTIVYLDIEGIPATRSYYLIGLLVSRSGVIEEKSFWARTGHEEVQIFIELLDYLKQYEECSIYHYGAYEIRALRSMQRRLPASYADQIDRVLKCAVNVLSIIGPHIYFPVYSNSLKEIAGHLGYTWSNSNASGIQALRWRQEWDATRDESAREELIRYNLEDCAALKVVTDAVGRIVDPQPTGPQPDATFLNTDHFEKEPRQRHRYQRLGFALPDFDVIHRCSYFDYQQDKLSARSGRLKRGLPKRRGSKLPKNNKVVEVLACRCGACHSRQVQAVRPQKRQILDLRFSGAAVRRWVVLYVSNKYRCKKCGIEFLPDEFPATRSKFGKGLVSWCIYQMIVGGQNIARIRVGLMRLYGLEIANATVYRFKEAVADHLYRLRSDILTKIMASAVVYIDETSVDLRSEAGYVWCISDGSSVCYFYRSSREGSFLPEMFRDFRGILVSDFYAAYDAIDCRQQRCLVHLMRDFNEEIHDHPFDGELKVLAARFSGVLRSAVETIDRYGFKSRHLSKHKKAAHQFCEWAQNQDFRSAAAERLRSRITKYHDKLFTFLSYDGVPWNNATAEYFIKPFARCRNTTNGKFTKRSVEDLLVILSAAQTCRGHKQDFLDFLMGGTSDRFSFKTGRRSTSR